ncbi:hypothetical protein RB213_012722 [Colletotrichum asianum]
MASHRATLNLGTYAKSLCDQGHLPWPSAPVLDPSGQAVLRGLVFFCSAQLTTNTKRWAQWKLAFQVAFSTPNRTFAKLQYPVGSGNEPHHAQICRA